MNEDKINLIGMWTIGVIAVIGLFCLIAFAGYWEHKKSMSAIEHGKVYYQDSGYRPARQ